MYMSVPKVNIRELKRKTETIYQLDYNLNGKRHRVAVGSDYNIAEQVKLDTQSKLIKGHFDLLPHTKQKPISLNILIDEFLDFKKNSIRSTSYKRYQNYIKKFHDYFNDFFPDVVQDIGMIRGLYIKKCMDYLIKGNWSKKTINGMRELVSSMFNYAIQEGYIEKNPVLQTKNYYIPEKGKVIFFTDDQLEIIWKELDPFWIGHLKFLLHTGLRKGELINLHWENVNLIDSEYSITITSSYEWLTKTGKYRSIPLNMNATNIIKKQKGKHPIFVFTDKKGKKIHPNQPYNALKKVLKDNEIQGDIHAFRHTFASNLAMNNVDLFSISKLLGTTPETAQIYAHFSPDYFREAIKKLEK
jgi:integrase